MLDDLAFTRHARDRATARAIPPGVAALILDYGEAQDARAGAGNTPSPSAASHASGRITAPPSPRRSPATAAPTSSSVKKRR